MSSPNTTSNLVLPGGTTKSFQAGEDMDGNLAEIVELATDNQIVVAGNGEKPVGVLVQVDGTGVGAMCLVCISGPCKVKAGAAFNEGVNLASDANGEAVLATTGESILGQALSAAAAANELVPVNVAVGGVVAA